VGLQKFKRKSVKNYGILNFTIKFTTPNSDAAQFNLPKLPIQKYKKTIIYILIAPVDS